jgi:hypothetical protein
MKIGQHWFVLDSRTTMQDYVASFTDEIEAREYAERKLGAHAFVTDEPHVWLTAPSGNAGQSQHPSQRVRIRKSPPIKLRRKDED